MIGCAIDQRSDDGELLLATYTEPAERDQLASAVLAHAALAIRTLARQSGVTPESVLGGLAAMLRGM